MCNPTMTIARTATTTSATQGRRAVRRRAGGTAEGGTTVPSPMRSPASALLMPPLSVVGPAPPRAARRSPPGGLRARLATWPRPCRIARRGAPVVLTLPLVLDSHGDVGSPARLARKVGEVRLAVVVEQVLAPVPGGTGRYTAEVAEALAAV